MKRLFFFATFVLLLVSCGQSAPKSDAPAEPAPKAEAAPVEAAPVKAEPTYPKVYSNCYDGYLNVRAEPSSNAAIVGELRNGPHGAELLGVEGKWSKVRVNGVVGYVFSSYLQSEPTDPVSINAAAVVGDWYSEEFEGGNWYDKITVKSNGQFYREYWFGVDMNDRINGTWYLSRNKLVLKWADGTVDSCTVNGKYLNWDGTKFYRM